jgi:hypothetical protein
MSRVVADCVTTAPGRTALDPTASPVAIGLHVALHVRFTVVRLIRKTPARPIPSRSAGSRGAAHQLPHYVGILAFNRVPRVLQSPTRDREALDAVLDRMTSSGTTATGSAIDAAVRVLRSAKGEPGTRPRRPSS